MTELELELKHDRRFRLHITKLFDELRSYLVRYNQVGLIVDGEKESWEFRRVDTQPGFKRILWSEDDPTKDK